MRATRAFKRILLGVALTVGSVGVLSDPASADVTCTPGGDYCQIINTVATPAGVMSISVSPGNIVTVHLTPVSPKTLVFGSPREIPPGPPAIPGYSRSTFDTGVAGVINIDEIVVPPGPPARGGLSSLVVISIHPPSPCHVSTLGNTVVFTPIA